jgi:indole-3-glycerol phosphate synthase
LDRNSIIKTLKYKMNILDKIIVDKEEKSFSKINHSCFSIRSLCLFSKKTISLSENLKNSTTGIIAEHKRRSPSKAEINYSFTVEEVKGYENAGACGISVLTDGKYFGGSR